MRNLLELGRWLAGGVLLVTALGVAAPATAQYCAGSATLAPLPGSPVSGTVNTTNAA